MEPKTSQLPIARSLADGSPQSERLLVASRLASSLAAAHQPEEVAAEAVHQLHEHFDYYLAVVQRLDPDVRVAVHGVPDRIVYAASRARQLASCGLDAVGIAARVRALHESEALTG